MTSNINVTYIAHTHCFKFLYISSNIEQLNSLRASALVDL